MMNGMMKMNGDLDDMGMRMSLNQMDMNVVMYPEIVGASGKKKPAVKKAEGGGLHDMNNMGEMDHGQKMDQQPNQHHAHQDTAKQAQMNHAMDANRYNANALSSIKTLNYAMLKAPADTRLPEGPVKELRFVLTGNMNRYVWSLDNKVISETDKILIRKGENVRMVIYNNSMMRHPMHLHGHDFRVLNGQGEKAPLKNIIDIMPMETDTLEFNAHTEGDWFFHCHILYHMMSGMGRVFTYANQPANPLIPDPKKALRRLYADDRRMHFMASNDFASNGNDGELMLQNTRWSIGSEWRLGYNDMHGYESETHVGRYLGTMQWFMPFIGFDWRYRKMGMDEHEKNLFGQKNTKDVRAAISVGFMYTLPMLVRFQAEVYHDGVTRLSLMREDIPVSKRLRAAFMVNTDKEYMGAFSYLFTRNLAVRAHYDSDMGFGAGVTVSY